MTEVDENIATSVACDVPTNVPTNVACSVPTEVACDVAIKKELVEGREASPPEVGICYIFKLNSTIDES